MINEARVGARSTFQLVELYAKGVIGADVNGDGNTTAVANAADEEN